jgi:proline iminopeptidase
MNNAVAAMACPRSFFNGGPGSSIGPNHRRFFDSGFLSHRVGDQRGCGQSTPAGGLEGNTLEHLIGDIERLREHLGVRRWMLFGGSWGSTLAIAYAQAHLRSRQRSGAARLVPRHR